MILKGQGLSVTYRQHGVVTRALDGVDFSLKNGEITGVAGESGCGKTTLARVLAGLIKPDAGTVDLDGLNIFKKQNEILLRRNVQMVFQNPYASFDPRYTVFDSLYESLGVFHKLNERKARSIVASLLFYCGLEPVLMLRYPHELSGGQLQRAAIARSIINKPRIVIFDEPTSSLDLTTAAHTIAFLQQLQQRHGLTFLFISHNLRLLRRIAHNLVIMYKGKVVEQGPCRDICDKPGHPYTRVLLDAAYQRAGRLSQEEEFEAACSFYGRCPRRSEKCLKAVSSYNAENGRIIFCNHSNEF